jgi:acyl carrier protein
MPPLAGIVHAAGVLSDASIQNQSAEKIQSVFAPKVDGARYLDAHTARHGLDFFVLFSSVSALIGMPGQANYAAANAFLDAFAHERQAAGRPTYSINWGRWDRVGVGASLATADARVRARWDGWGLVATSPADGLRALERALSARAPQAIVLPLERPKFLAGFPGARRGSLFRAFDVDPPSLGGHPRTGFLASVAAAPPSARSELFLALVRGEVGRVLGQSEDIPDDRKPLAAGGVDSLMAIELGNTLGTILHRSLPATLVFNYPTIAELAAHLEQAWDRRKARESAPVATTPIDHEAALLAEIESLSDGEAEAELEYELSPESKRK